MKCPNCLKNGSRVVDSRPADIKDDLDADSLDVFEIMNELEDDLDIKLEADENIKTIQDVVTYVKKELDNK